MPIVMGFRAKVIDLARQCYGWEDIAIKLNCVGVARLHVKQIVIYECMDYITHPATRWTNETRRHECKATPRA